MSESSLHDRFRERIAAAGSDRQSLVDIDLEIQLETDIDGEAADGLTDDIYRRLEALGGWGEALPSRLVLCPYCEKVRDRRPGGTLSSCLCAGGSCRRCGAGRIHRPISDHYELRDHRLWHTPYFGLYIPCRWCAEAPDGSAVIRLVHDAAHALRRSREPLGRELPAHHLVALHGTVEDWHDRRLGAPPDGRPLYAGRSLEDLHLPAGSETLGVGTWEAPGGATHLERVLHELLVRWQPPLNQDVSTPWNSG